MNKKIDNSIRIICDSREKKNNHILNYLNDISVDYVTRKLDYGDYSVELKENNSLGIEPFSLEDEIVVERKGSGNTGLDELAINITKYRKNFEKMIEKSVVNNADLHLIIEDGSWGNIYNSLYRSKVSNKSYIATLMTYLNRYNIDIHMVKKKYSPKFIYSLLYYYAREYLKRGDYDCN